MSQQASTDVSAGTRGPDVSAETRIALHAGPLLAPFNAAGILGAADVHVARRLGRLAREDDERVLLAVALAVRAVRSGSVCVFLDDLAALAVPEGEDVVEVGELPWPEAGEWRAAIEASPLVPIGVHGPADRPVRWLDGRLYLDRYWRHEMVVRRAVDARLAAPAPGGARARRWPPPRAGCSPHRRTIASASPRRRRCSAGSRCSPAAPAPARPPRSPACSPSCSEVAGPDLRVALAAPTGKAAARLQEAVRAEVARLGEPDRAAVGEPEATTVHRLLGWRPGSSTRFRHDADHHLPHDVVVVDETSMVSLPLMARLLEALRPEARLLLVGDPDQLASVEAGAVLGDLVARPPVADRFPPRSRRSCPHDVPTDAATLDALRNGVVRLERVHRFSGAIADLAAAIRAGDADRVLAVLRSGAREVDFVEAVGERLTDAEAAGVRRDATAAGTALVTAARAGDAAGALRALESHRLLLAHRRGPAGVAHWAALVEGWVREAAGPDATESPWYPGPAAAGDQQRPGHRPVQRRHRRRRRRRRRGRRRRLRRPRPAAARAPAPPARPWRPSTP